jgi:hypothetical protein
MMKKIDLVAIILLILGGLNWGLWGLFEMNFIYSIFGQDWLARLIYFLIGVSAAYVIWTRFFRKK